MEGLVHNGEEFEVGALKDGEPVEVFEEQGAGEETGSRFLDLL